MLQVVALTFLITTCRALYPAHSDVIELTPANFDRFVINSDEVWLIKFFTPWCQHCQQLVPEYEKTAQALKGVVKVGAVDVDRHKDLGQRFGIRGFPTIKIFGANKNKAEIYKGQRSAKNLVQAAMEAVETKINANVSVPKSKDVVELTDGNFDERVLKSDDMWLVEFFAPWCGHCKNLAPNWAQAATELKGKVSLGALDATVSKEKASQFGVKGYPTIKYFPAGQKNLNSTEDYNGGRSASDIVNWALEKLAENLPAPEVIQILDKQLFKEACELKLLCVFSVLPNILDCQAECRNSYLDILGNTSENYKRKMWGWTWSEAGAQPNLESSLGIGGFGYPAMAAIHFKKLKYSLLRGPFSKDGINEFLRDLSYGRGNTAPIKNGEFPKIVVTQPWDGKDGELPTEEDPWDGNAGELPPEEEPRDDGKDGETPTEEEPWDGNEGELPVEDEEDLSKLDEKDEL